MFDFLANIVDVVKGRDRADRLIKEWHSTHQEDYAQFVAGIEAMQHGDLTAAFEMYHMMHECMPPEAVEYYDIIVDIFSGNPRAYNRITQIKYANEICICAIKGIPLEISLGTGEVRLTENPSPKKLVVRSEDVIKRWNNLPLTTRAYYKEQFNKLLNRIPNASRQKYLEVMQNLAKLYYVTNLTYMPAFMANLMDKAVVENNPLLFAMYYFVVFDHGLQRMARLLTAVVEDEVPEMDGIVAFKQTIHMLVVESIHGGQETKESWTKYAETSTSDEEWKEIAYALRDAKTKVGRKHKVVVLDDMLVGDKDKIKQLIRQFLDEHPETSYMAYLLCAMRDAGCIRCERYMDFHRGVERLMDTTYGYSKAQQRFFDLREMKDYRNDWSRKGKTAAEIIYRWTDRFRRMENDKIIGSK